ncbi:MAG TPA: aminotransferase class I/II-fold pyridoxal phosphate-dependent enzyme [Gammaproteobacteria bacterium]|nr:aminotransferase class I/II-fold pyridoxal phosphate-dependent enzyme [Gammaproteobacteria bacterium]
MTDPDSAQRHSPHVHLNLNVRGLGPSATLAINEHSAELQRQGREVFRLGLGQSPFPVPEFVAQALRENAHQKDYLPVKGLPALREAVTDFYRRTEGLDYKPENILVGPGTKELMFIVQLVYYGDLVIPTPSWVSYAPQAHILGRQIRWLPTEPGTGMGVQAHELETLCQQDPERPRLLILNYPGNPTGVAYDEAQLREIAEVARRYRVLVLSDEIYSGTRFDGRHVSIARFYPEGTIISNGLSKWCGAGGWRLGAFAFPSHLSWLLDGMAAVASETFTSTSAPIQHASVSAFLGGPELDDYLDRSRRVLAGLADFFQRTLNEAGAKVVPAQGGFYLFPSFEPVREKLLARGIRNSDQMCRQLLDDTGVAILPGYNFGRPMGEFSARLAFVDFEGAAALRGIGPDGTADETFLRQYCDRVVKAAERMAAWINE